MEVWKWVGALLAGATAGAVLTKTFSPSKLARAPRKFPRRPELKLDITAQDKTSHARMLPVKGGWSNHDGRLQLKPKGDALALHIEHRKRPLLEMARDSRGGWTAQGGKMRATVLKR
jgi:hypothetical protein